MYKLILKRTLDIIISASCLLLLLPLLPIIALLIFIEDPGTIFFKQKRVGKDKKMFLMLKFRSMRMGTPRDVPTHLLENPDAYITRIGKFLRRTSIDELPQLINVLLGDMSLIGPRPALWNQKDLISERDKCGANDIRPGLTGWAQINGRDKMEIPLKARYDCEYAHNMCFRLDLSIFLRSVITVLKREGFVEGMTTPKERNAKGRS